MTIEELYDEYHSEMVKWGKKMTGSEQTSEELVQESFLRALLNEELIVQLKEKQARSWLYRTAKNIYVDKVRHFARESLTEEIPEQREQINDFYEFEMDELINKLSDVERIIFKMKCDGYNSSQIGKVLNLPAGTVRSKLSLARKHLKKLFN